MKIKENNELEIIQNKKDNLKKKWYYMRRSKELALFDSLLSTK